MGTLTDLIEKVRKLRALANSTNVHEASAAAKAADRLMQEHGIEEAQLEISGVAPEEVIGEDVSPVAVWRGKIPTWQVSLCFGLVWHYGCAGYRAWDGRGGQVARIVGRPSDVAKVRYMWAWLSAEIERLAQTHKGAGRSWLDSFRKGAVRGVLEKLGESKREAEESTRAKEAVVSAIVGSSGGSTALAIYQNRGNAARDKMHELHEDLAKAAKRRRGGSSLPGASNSDGYSEGKEAGRNIHTGAALGGGASAPRLGDRS